MSREDRSGSTRTAVAAPHGSAGKQDKPEKFRNAIHLSDKVGGKDEVGSEDSCYTNPDKPSTSAAAQTFETATGGSPEKDAEPEVFGAAPPVSTAKSSSDPHDEATGFVMERRFPKSTIVKAPDGDGPRGTPSVPILDEARASKTIVESESYGPAGTVLTKRGHIQTETVINDRAGDADGSDTDNSAQAGDRQGVKPRPPRQRPTATKG